MSTSLSRWLQWSTSTGKIKKNDEEKAVDELDEEEDRTPVQKLHAIQKRCVDQTVAEEQVCARLQPLQTAFKFPTYYSAGSLLVDLPVTIPEGPANASSSLIKDYIRIPGTLISVVDGFLLRDMRLVDHEEDWTNIIGVATAVVNEICTYGILNSDIRPENVFIQKLVRSPGDGTLANNVKPE